MENFLQNTLLTTAFEHSDIFIGIYNKQENHFEYINKKGLSLLKINNIQEYKVKYPNGFKKTDFKKDALKSFTTKKMVLDEEDVFQNHAGEEFYGLLHLSEFHHNSNTYEYINISKIKYNDGQQLMDQENRFEALFMHAAIGIIVVEKSGKIALTNLFADNLFGYKKGEMMNQNLEILIPSSLRHRHKQVYENFTENPKARPMGLGLDLNGQRKDGVLFPVEISLSHFTSENTQYFICFINDMTFKKKAEESLISKNNEIQKLNESLENEVIKRTHALVQTLKNLEKSKKDLEVALEKEKELGELKSRFVSMASHEFRTPLTSILSSASLIEKYEQGDEQEKRKKHTARIKAAVGNLTNILEEFLSVGKLEEGRIETHLSTFNLPNLVDDCRDDLQSLIKAGQYISYEHTGHSEIHTDKSLIRKIIINLCSNAIKFSPEKSQIFVYTVVTADELKITVKDAGIGISQADQKHLFDRFFRGANATNIQGTGLGLHIVARYVNLLNGSITFDSKLDHGSSFHVKILL